MSALPPLSEVDLSVRALRLAAVGSWVAVYQFYRHWITAAVFGRIIHDLRILLRMGEDREPSGTIKFHSSSDTSFSYRLQ